MSLVTNKRGDIFLAFWPSADDTHIPSTYTGIPLTHALIIVHHKGMHLLIYNRWRQQWEVPGGIIETGESPHECIVRELFEETGQKLDNLTFRGWMKFQLQPDQRLEIGALYSGILRHIAPFEANAEADRITFWDSVADIGYVNEIDRMLLEYG